MPNFNNWFTNSINSHDFTPNVADRAAAEYRKIQDKPSTVAVWRGGSFHHSETVRVEWGNSTNTLPQSTSPNTVTAITEVVVFGINGHETLTNTDIVEGDEIALSGETYQVKDVLITLGELQARCVRIT